MANLEIEGRLHQVLEPTSGTSAKGEWISQSFVIEVNDGRFTSFACFDAWGQDKINDLSQFNIGDSVKVSFNIRSREFKGRWYTNLSMWRIVPAGQAGPNQFGGGFQGQQGQQTGGFNQNQQGGGFQGQQNGGFNQNNQNLNQGLEVGTNASDDDDLPF